METEETKVIQYNDEDQEYIGELKERLTKARDLREQQHDFFDGMTYSQYYESNKKGALTYIEPKKDKYDNNFQSGTIRSKLFALLSHVNNLNLSPDVSAFDSENVEVQSLGNALEQIIYKTEEVEVDEEKKIQRQYELLEQGTVFVEEVWCEKNKKVKKGGKFKGNSDIKWTELIKKSLPYPERNVISGLGVYLGDVRQYFIEKQPYIFTVETMPYKMAEKIFGKWDRWEYVPETIVRNPDTEINQTYGWQITELEDDKVEVIRYQDLPNNEYAVIINGILMTPAGLPLQWGWEGYNITQQNLEIMDSNFAYGKSMVARLKSNTAILDEMLRLAVLKTQKSFSPPYLNISGKVISSKVFMPGKITNGILPNQLQPLGSETMGVTGPEMSMIQKLEMINDTNSISPSFQGQQAQGDTTATEVLQMQRQSKMLANNLVTACSLLEYKCSWLRLFNILNNWFDPVDTTVNEANELVNKYRSVNRETPIEGRGMGRTMVIPSKEYMTPMDVKNRENEMQKSTGKPVRMIMVNPELVKSSKYIWQIAIKPREKRTSELDKLMMREMVTDYMTVSQLQSAYLKEKWANAWDLDPTKVFGEVQPTMPQEMGTQAGRPAMQNIQNPAKTKNTILNAV